MNLALKAMEFACNAHKLQVRKYTGEPYEVHLAQVAGIAAAALMQGRWGSMETPLLTDIVAVAWLHDCVEDCGVTHQTLVSEFGETIADAVLLLSDLETGNRATRKALSRERLSKAPGWVQTLKVADIISNTSSILQHDPEFGAVFMLETEALLQALTRADSRLVEKARQMRLSYFGWRAAKITNDKALEARL
jgi:(p)ppGpp synthase/HD superfamily hydrolase